MDEKHTKLLEAAVADLACQVQDLKQQLDKMTKNRDYWHGCWQKRAEEVERLTQKP